MQKQKLSSASSRKKFRKMLTRLTGAAFICSAVFAGNHSFAQGPNNPKQNPLWLMSNNSNYASTKHNQFKFYYNGRAEVDNIYTGGLTNQYQLPVTHVFNNMPDNYGNLNFYVGLVTSLSSQQNPPDLLNPEDGQGDIEIIRSDGHRIGVFAAQNFSTVAPYTMYNYPEFLVMPLSNDCSTGSGKTAQPGYLVFGYRPNNYGTATAGKVYYAVVYPGQPGTSNDILFGTYNPDTNLGFRNMADISSPKGTFAAPKPVVGRTQFVYLATKDGIYKFVVNPAIAPSTNPLAQGIVSTPSQGTIVSARIEQLTNADIPELEVSEDGTRLAWASGNTVYVMNVDPITGNRISGPMQITLPKTVNGLEFIPNSYSLYATAGTDNNSTDGVFRINWSGTSYITPTQRSGTTIWAQRVAQSHIETDYNGNMVMLGADYMIRLNPATDNFISPTGFSKAMPQYNYGNVRRLPRQIDGWHYNVAGLVYGAASVQVSGTGAVPTQTYTAPQMPGATYFWSYTGPNGIPVSLGTNSVNSRTINFTGLPLGTYIVNVTTTYTNNNCPVQTNASLNVTTNNGTPPPDGSHMAQANGNSSTYHTATIYPNPATGKFTLDLPEFNAEAKVRIVDVNGKTWKTFTATQQQQTVEVSSLKSGVYLLYVESEGRIATQKLVILN